MANEAILRTKTEEPILMAIDDTAGVEKGTIMMLEDPRKVSGTNITTGNTFGGIMRREKIANDGRTQAACFFGGIFDMKVNSSVAVTIGAQVCLSGANLIRDATEAEIAAGAAIGKALETGAASEVIQVFVGK